MSGESDTRLRLAARLNWDYEVRPEELLAVIDGRIDKAGPFDRNRLLVRSLERLTWHKVVELWGADRLAAIDILPLIGRLRSRELRRRYGFVFRLLRKEAVPSSGWGPELRGRVRSGLLSNRWDRPQPRVRQP